MQPSFHILCFWRRIRQLCNPPSHLHWWLCRRSAIGLRIPYANVTISATLIHRTSTIATELVVMWRALLYIKDQRRDSRVILCDSRTALQSKSPHSQEQVVLNIRRLSSDAHEFRHDIVLQWLRAHCALPGMFVVNPPPEPHKTLHRRELAFLFQQKM